MSPEKKRQMKDKIAGALFFSELSATQLETVLESGTLRELHKGDTLHALGDKVECISVISEGWFKLSRTTLDGAEAVLDVLGRGNLIGFVENFGGQVFDSQVVAVEKSEVVSFPVAVVIEILERDPSAYKKALRLVSNNQKILQKEIEGRSLQTAPQRLGCFLLRLVPADDLLRNATVLHLPYDKILLAARLGMQPETFSRALAKLKADLGLDVKGSTLTVPDVRGLVSYTCSACSGTFPCGQGCKSKPAAA